jgi:hypothetical protein
MSFRGKTTMKHFNKNDFIKINVKIKMFAHLRLNMRCRECAQAFQESL